MNIEHRFPSDHEIDKAVRALHERPEMAVIAVTGAFAGLQRLLWDTPGSSKTLLDASLHYSRLSIDQFIRRTPSQYCSAETALRMAVAAYERADRLVRLDKEFIERRPPVIGLGGTASTATDRVKKGKDRFHVAVRTRDRMMVASAEFFTTFIERELTRQEEGRLCDIVALNLLLYAAGLEQVPMREFSQVITSKQLAYDDQNRFVVKPHEMHLDPGETPNMLGSINRGEFFRRPLIKPDGQRGTTDELDPKRHLLFPGSFNPLHGGHKQMARQAERFAGLDVVCAVTGRHPDKGEIPVEELERRARQFAWMHPVLFVEDASLYVEWARKFPGFGFIIGADSLRRMLDPTYYGGREDRDAMLEELGGLDAKFYVFSRRVGDDLLTLHSVLESSDAPETFCQRCTHLPGTWNVSSTEIRNRQPGGAS